MLSAHEPIAWCHPFRLNQVEDSFSRIQRNVISRGIFISRTTSGTATPPIPDAVD
jgi:hypothetical protein